MNDLKNILNETFRDIRFLEENHEYFLNNVKYLGVSSLISLYTPEFNKEEVSKKVAFRDGVTPLEILTRWTVRREYSTVKGTEFHFYVYKYLTEGKKMETITPIKKEIEQFHDFWDNKNRDRYEIIATELIVYDEELQLAGTIDCILRNRNDGKYYIVDWKTNKLIRSFNTFEKMKSPMEHLDNCEQTKYDLQTSIYRNILERQFGEFIAGSYLIHCCEDKDNYEVITCNHLKTEVDNLFEIRLKSLSQ